MYPSLTLWGKDTAARVRVQVVVALMKAMGDTMTQLREERKLWA